VDDPALAQAAGDVAGWPFTIDGTVVSLADRRVILGMSPDQLRAVPYSIGFAGGPAKAEAAIGAARAGLINVLITDAATARVIDAQLDPG
jgi:DNA-binding transcriptional regulator LsrR (DeoR family)